LQIFLNPYIKTRVVDLIFAQEIELHLKQFGVLKGIAASGLSAGEIISLIVSKLTNRVNEEILAIEVCIEIITDNKLLEQHGTAIKRAFTALGCSDESVFSMRNADDLAEIGHEQSHCAFFRADSSLNTLRDDPDNIGSRKPFPGSSTQHG